MKIRPGIVMSSENAKNQRRLPMTSNTRRGLSADGRPTRRPVDELGLGDAVEASLRAQSWATTMRRIVRVTVIAVNIEARTPRIRTRAKPWITDEPKKYRIEAVIRLDTFESRIEFQARANPASMAWGSDLPRRSSSLDRSKMRMLASTAMPTERTKPAMPARVRVTGMSRKTANRRSA